MMTYLVDTAEMPAWTGEQEPPRGRYPWGVYTSLGAFQPKWGDGGFVPVIARIQHQARHQPKLRWGQLRKWSRNATREICEGLVGAFVPIMDAL